MTDLEFQLAQYADGTLPAGEIAFVEKVLAADAEARALVEEYRRVDALLRRELPLPAVNWDRLAAHLSSAVASTVAEEVHAARPMRLVQPTETVVRGSFAQTWVRLAMAAAVLLAMLGVLLFARRPAHPPAEMAEKVHHHFNPTGVPMHHGPPTAITDVIGPSIEQSRLPVVSDVSVSPARGINANASFADDAIVSRPAHVLIASDQPVRQDVSWLPY